MKAKTEMQVGVVDEVSNGSMRANPTVEKWHFRCKKCAQVLRIPARGDIEFICVSCRQNYSVNYHGQIFMEVSAVRPAKKELAKAAIQNCDATSAADSKRCNHPNVPAQPSSATPAVNTNGGLLGRLVGGLAAVAAGTSKAASEANEAARGAALLREYESTMQGIRGLSEKVLALALANYVDKVSKLKNQSENWTREGCIKMARTLQKEARKRIDFNMAEAYALWMAGAWLETKWRTTPQADFVHLELEGMWRRLNGEL